MTPKNMTPKTMTTPNRPLRWAGLDLTHPRVMGILNVTPDSFSDGGSRIDSDTAVRAGITMMADGADIVDVGGESTRPGAQPVSPHQEIDRIVPVIRALGKQGVRVSVDTRHALTMRAALDAGAAIVNDVSGLSHDPESVSVVAAYGCPVVLMHMRGTPATMNAQANYQDVVGEVVTELARRIEAARQAGIADEQIAIDPGIGFAKLAAHSQALLQGLPQLTNLGYPLLVGVSRKGFIGALSKEPVARQRLGGSIAAALFAVSRGASILRVHDVRETVQAFRVWQGLFE